MHVTRVLRVLRVLRFRVLPAAARGATGIAGVLRRLLGAPDYERYLAHQRVHHPSGAVLTQREFLTLRLADRYERPGSRCC